MKVDGQNQKSSPTVALIAAEFIVRRNLPLELFYHFAVNEPLLLPKVAQIGQRLCYLEKTSAPGYCSDLEPTLSRLPNDKQNAAFEPVNEFCQRYSLSADEILTYSHIGVLPKAYWTAQTSTDVFVVCANDVRLWELALRVSPRSKDPSQVPR